VGYGVIRDRELFEIFRKTQPPFSLGTPGMVLASVVLEDRDFLEATRRYVAAAKARVLRALGDRGELIPSATDGRTPIVTLSAPRGDLFALMSQRGVATEPGSGYMDLDERAVRLRVPPPDDLESLEERCRSLEVPGEEGGSSDRARGFFAP